LFWHRYCWGEGGRTQHLSPRANFMERGDFTMKKILTHIFFAAAMMFCFSMTTMAQKQGEKPARPPKEPPPVIVPGKKPEPKDEKPKEDKKKPQTTVFYFRED